MAVTIIADDLTGANDTAIQFRKRGYPAIAGIQYTHDSDLRRFDAYEVLALNTDTRAMDGDAAYRVVAEAVSRCLSVRRGTIYKKVDSLLRGNPGHELDAIMDATDTHLAVVAFAYPQNGRVVVDGHLQASEGIALDAVELFRSQMHHRVAHVGRHLLGHSVPDIVGEIRSKHRAGDEVFVFDSLDDEDLEKIRLIGECLQEPYILCGSAGFANVISVDAKPGVGSALLAEPRAEGLVCLVCGTRNKQAQLQVSEVLRQGIAPVCVFDGEKSDLLVASDDLYLSALRSIERRADSLVIAVSAAPEEVGSGRQEEANSEQRAKDISRLLGDVVSRLYKTHPMKGIVLTGGDTAQQVCRALGAYGIVPDSELAPGVPFGTLAGGFADGTFVVTKSGGFGRDTVLAESIRYLRRRV